MIFASDLDRTLIYSCKSFKQIVEKDSYVVIDRDINGVDKSIMSLKAVEMLREFNKYNTFVPVTAREEKHCNDRLRFHEYGIFFDYIVLGNGAVIHYKGEEDIVWKSHVKGLLDKIDMERIEYLLIDKYGKENINKTSYGYEIRVETSMREVEKLIGGVKGINVGRNHRYYFILINGIDKLEALKYVSERLNKKKEDLIVAGDSFMDIPMIEYAKEKGILSLNGHISMGDDYLKDVENKGTFLVQDVGIRAGEVILNKVLELSKR